MPEAIRTVCKFRVVSVEQVEHTVKTDADGKAIAWAENVQLAASYDPSNKEDVSFSAATPSGNLKIYVSNPEVVGTFKIGSNYYLHLVPIA